MRSQHVAFPLQSSRAAAWPPFRLEFIEYPDHALQLTGQDAPAQAEHPNVMPFNEAHERLEPGT